MNYAMEFRKFATSHSIYSAVRITLAIVIPSMILAHFGLLKEYFLFPLATSFVGLTDQAGPFIRRRNALIIACICFFLVAAVASLVMGNPLLVYAEIIIFGLFFSMIGIYGQRLAAVGGLSLVVLAIFIDGHLVGANAIKSLLTFLAGSVFYLIVFLIVSKIQPYKLASQMIGENFLELAEYLDIKSKFYEANPDFELLQKRVIAQQIKIKNLQEETRETVFKTRKIVNESTATGRLLILMFLDSMDLHEKLMTSESDYKTIQKGFGDSGFLPVLAHFLSQLSKELSNIGVALQGGLRTKPLTDLDAELEHVFENYFDLRNKRLNPETLENFMLMRLILVRISDVTKEIKSIYRIFNNSAKLSKKQSASLDLQKFVTNSEKFDLRVFFTNFSRDSSHFRHSVRITVALLIGYFISTLEVLGIGHTYWILITVIAIMRPAYSTTKHRNLLRLYGTIAGAIIAYILLFLVHEPSVLFGILMICMILCFSLLRESYSWAVMFMTIYIFLTFNFLNPGNVNIIFKDRILDTAIAGVVAFLVSYFILPVWEHTQNLSLMKKSAKSNLNYFEGVIEMLQNKTTEIQEHKLRRKNALIDLANLSDNFQRMISDPKNQQIRLEYVHQFVSTAHLITSYIASLGQFNTAEADYPEIDLQSWNIKISAELSRTVLVLESKTPNQEIVEESKIIPADSVDDLLEQRRAEIRAFDIVNHRDPARISHLTEVKNLKEILELIFDVATDQRKVAEKLYEYHQLTMVKQ